MVTRLEQNRLPSQHSAFRRYTRKDATRNDAVAQVGPYPSLTGGTTLHKRFGESYRVPINTNPYASFGVSLHCQTDRVEVQWAIEDEPIQMGKIRVRLNKRLLRGSIQGSQFLDASQE